MSVDNDNDSGLWDLLVDGDERAYSTLFRKYYASLVSYGKSLTQHHNLVSDCVQEVFLDIWLYRKTLTHPSYIKAYLLSGVRKRIARRLERERIFRNPQPLDQVETTFKVEFNLNFTVLDEMIHDEETRNQVLLVNKLLNQLPERQKEALYLRYHQGLEITQIADLMDINPQSASNLLHRGIKYLRRSWMGEISLLILTFHLFY